MHSISGRTSSPIHATRYSKRRNGIVDDDRRQQNVSRGRVQDTCLEFHGIQWILAKTVREGMKDRKIGAPRPLPNTYTKTKLAFI
ncbi:unnamed protein product [Angiostrongylus costaricensis]|uniref:Uncharacterized protein n=1 Tax=Angiostrongylus costaricensis TaxID=334426 RepID=A0A0R3PIW9_ANGCS|nr:unnamed protein product [Angiostrongylus costaricensis]